MKIGFFDSGLGGLILLKAVAKTLPDYDYVFYGDTANVPYGDKAEEEIFLLTKAGVEYLFANDCLLVVVACNTASAETLRRLQDTILIGKYSERRILGVIIPTVEVLVDGGFHSAGLIATRRTVESGKYDLELGKFTSGLKLVSVAEGRLVPLIEAEKVVEAEEIMKEHLDSLIAHRIPALILGCTHFCLLKDFARIYSQGKVVIISQDELIPPKLSDYLKRHSEIEKRLSRDQTRVIHLTDNTSRHDKIISLILGGVMVKD